MSPLTQSSQAIPKRPRPVMAERISLTLPNLPKSMQGMQILHLSDIHVRRFRPWFRRMIDMVSHERPDYVWLTGDYVTIHGDERAALRVMGDLFNALVPKYGIYASFGNHDTPGFKRMAMKQLTQCFWLEHEALYLPEHGITLMGSSTPGDLFATNRRAIEVEQAAGIKEGESYRIILGHEPGILVTAADLGIEWTLAGHTHGGQLRIGLPMALHNSTDIPRTQSSGILRCRDSICTISRGLGESYFDIRLLCPPHLPMYVLERGPLPGPFTRKMTCVRWW